MTKVTYIPNEIANAAVDEHGNRKPVTRTHHIFDDAKGKNQQDINEDIYNQIQLVKEGREKSKGYYDSYQSLIQNISSPEVGDWAIVKSEFDNHWYIYKCAIEGYWEETDEQYTSEVNLNGYTKEGDFKTINGQSILGEGDIEYEIASQDNNGLLSKELYVQLITLRNETIPRMQEHIDNILTLFDDEQTPEYIQAIIDRYNQICEFIANLGDSDNGQILEQILTDIDTLQDDVSEINQKITDLEQNPVVPENLAGHIFLTQEEYDALTTYEKDTLYIILEPKNSEGSSFGDAFPIILA